DHHTSGRTAKNASWTRGATARQSLSRRHRLLWGSRIHRLLNRRLGCLLVLMILLRWLLHRRSLRNDVWLGRALRRWLHLAALTRYVYQRVLKRNDMRNGIAAVYVVLWGGGRWFGRRCEIRVGIETAAAVQRSPGVFDLFRRERHGRHFV